MGRSAGHALAVAQTTRRSTLYSTDKRRMVHGEGGQGRSRNALQLRACVLTSACRLVCMQSPYFPLTTPYMYSTSVTAHFPLTIHYTTSHTRQDAFQVLRFHFSAPEALLNHGSEGLHFSAPEAYY